MFTKNWEVYFYYVIKTLNKGPDLESPIPPIQRPSGMLPFKESLHGVQEVR